MKMLGRNVLHGQKLVDAGIVDENIESSECFLRLSEKAFNVGLFANVCLNRDGPSPLPTISATTRSAPSLLEA